MQMRRGTGPSRSATTFSVLRQDNTLYYNLTLYMYIFVAICNHCIHVRVQAIVCLLWSVERFSLLRMPPSYMTTNFDISIKPSHRAQYVHFSLTALYIVSDFLFRPGCRDTTTVYEFCTSSQINERQFNMDKRNMTHNDFPAKRILPSLDSMKM